MRKRNLAALASLVLLAGCSGTMPTLGVTSGQFEPCSSKPNCVNSQAEDKEHFIQPLSFTGTSVEAKESLLNVLKATKNAQVVEVKSDYIRSEFTSKLLRFVDDVEFYLPEAQSSAAANQVLIHVRSASRVGYSDWGVNRERIEEIRTQLKAAEGE